jgi:hypothetical protein
MLTDRGVMAKKTVKLMRTEVNEDDRSLRYLVEFSPPLRLDGLDFSEGITLWKPPPGGFPPVRYGWICQYKDDTTLTPARSPNEPFDENARFAVISNGVMEVNDFLAELGRGKIPTQSWEETFPRADHLGGGPIEADGTVVFTEDQYQRHHDMDAMKIAAGVLVGGVVGFAIGRIGGGNGDGDR